MTRYSSQDYRYQRNPPPERACVRVRVRAEGFPLR